ncbi:hypothetical protein BDZ97DRAFT_1920634 [Flammula alnicola]|nr:hypothetical protein BDZ97DRAFT_1920634 [Flammula alnicola]
MARRSRRASQANGWPTNAMMLRRKSMRRTTGVATSHPVPPKHDADAATAREDNHNGHRVTMPRVPKPTASYVQGKRGAYPPLFRPRTRPPCCPLRLPSPPPAVSTARRLHYPLSPPSAVSPPLAVSPPPALMSTVNPRSPPQRPPPPAMTTVAVRAGPTTAAPTPPSNMVAAAMTTLTLTPHTTAAAMTMPIPSLTLMTTTAMWPVWDGHNQPTR